MAEGKTQDGQDNNPEKLKVFISYSRVDEKFADELVDGLNFDGRFEVTIDRHSIKQGEKWKPRLGALIEAADTVVFILSPESVSSEICQWEVDEAERLKKRLIPVLYRPLAGGAPPEQLADINYIDFTGDGTLMAGVTNLVTSLKEDLSWLKESTRLLNLALDWERAERRNNRLLSGQDIIDAKVWINGCPEDSEITELHRDYIKASEFEEEIRKDEERKRLEELAIASKRVARRTTVGLLVSFLLAGLAVWFGWQAYLGEQKAEQQTKIATEKTIEAERQREIAEKNSQVAKFEKERANMTLKESQLSQTKFLSKSATELMKQNRFGSLAALLALEALPDPNSQNELKRSRPFWLQANNALLRSEYYNLEKKIFSEHKHYAMDLGFNVDGHYIVVSKDKVVQLWSLETGKELKRFEGHKKFVTSVALSTDSQYIVSGSRDNTVRVWSVATGKELKRLEGHENNVTSVALSADGRYIVSGSDDKTVRLWDFATGEELKRFEEDKYTFTKVAFSADGDHVVTLSYDMTVRLWSVASGEELKRFKVSEILSSLSSLSADGRYIVVAKDKALQLWSIETGKEVQLFEGHTDVITSIAMGLDNRYIISGAWDKSVRLWSVETGKEIALFEGHESSVINVALTADDGHIVSYSSDKTIRMWALERDLKSKNFEDLESDIYSVVISADGRYVVSGSLYGTMRLRSVSSGEEIKRFEGHESAITSLSLSADGKYVVSGSYDKTVRLWSLETGEELKRFKGHEKTVKSVALSADGRYIVSGSNDNTVRLWSTKTGREIKRFKGHEYPVTSVSISANGRYMVSGSYDKTVLLWSLETGQELKRFEGHESDVTSVTISADGRFIVSGSRDETVRLWSTETGRELKRFINYRYTDTDMQKRFTRMVVSLALSVDGKYLLTGLSDNSVQLWSVETDMVIKSSYISKGLLTSVALSADGRHIVSASKAQPSLNNRTIQYWNVPEFTLIERVQNSMPRCLTKSERSSYFLSLQPPRWCITGVGQETEKDPNLWQPKYPYHTKAWKEWLLAKDAGKPVIMPAK